MEKGQENNIYFVYALLFPCKFNVYVKYVASLLNKIQKNKKGQNHFYVIAEIL